jgi:FkbM family methyltransferase
VDVPVIQPAPIDPPSIHKRLWHGFEGTVGWDIGANCGQTLTEMTTRFERVEAFEPAVECMPFLEPWERKAPVVVHQVALSNVDGHIPLAALPDKINTGQLVTPGTHGMEWSIDWAADQPEVARTVPARRIDTLILTQHPAPDFWKIDVEGHELLVLEGAEQTITDYMPDMLIEFHNQELHRACLECLTAHGYTELETVRHPHYRAGSEFWFNHGWVRVFAPR